MVIVSRRRRVAAEESAFADIATVHVVERLAAISFVYALLLAPEVCRVSPVGTNCSCTGSVIVPPEEAVPTVPAALGGVVISIIMAPAIANIVCITNMAARQPLQQ